MRKAIFLICLIVVDVLFFAISDLQSDNFVLKYGPFLAVIISLLSYYVFILMSKPGAILPGSKEKKITVAVCSFVFILMNLFIFFAFFHPYL